MAFYTTLSNTDIQALTKIYNIYPVTSYTAINGGNANSSYLIHTYSKKYVITTLEENNIQQSKSLARILQWLEQHGFHTSTVLSSTSSELITIYKDKPILVKEWISGTVIQDMDNDLLEDIGRTLARLHQVPVPEFLPRVYAMGVDSFTEVLDQNIDLDYEIWLKKQYNRIKNNTETDLPKGFIHGDLFFDNLLVENNQCKAIIDFEEAAYYDLIFDIGMAAVGLCDHENRIDLQKLKAFIKGYEQIRKLSSQEKTQLQFCIEYAATVISKWRYWKYNMDSPSQERKHKHLKMMQLAQAINSIDSKVFIQQIFNGI